MDTEEQNQIQQALNRAYFFLKFRPRTEKEVTDYLNKKAEKFHWSSEVVEKAIQSLKEKKYINDADFVEVFVHSRSNLKPKSRYALSGELGKFGVAKETIDLFFEENPVDEDSLASDALKRRWAQYQRFSKQERFQKAAAFLSRRGFSYEIIKKTIQQFENNTL